MHDFAKTLIVLIPDQILQVEIQDGLVGGDDLLDIPLQNLDLVRRQVAQFRSNAEFIEQRQHVDIAGLPGSQWPDLRRLLGLGQVLLNQPELIVFQPVDVAFGQGYQRALDGYIFCRGIINQRAPFYQKRLVFRPENVAAAFGGGAILACACDYRLMRSDRGFFCFPEVDVNIPFLPGMLASVQRAVPAWVPAAN